MRKYFVLALFLLFTILSLLSACNGSFDAKYERYYADGSQIYKVHCQNCHMAAGKGLARLIPPLTDTTYLKSNREKLACFIVYGLNDSIRINGIDYEGKMPAEKHLAAIDLAKVLTYITNSFGNNQGIYDVKEVEQNLNTCQ